MFSVIINFTYMPRGTHTLTELIQHRPPKRFLTNTNQPKLVLIAIKNSEIILLYKPFLIQKPIVAIVA